MVLVKKLKNWPRANKFNARRTTVDGVTFDSAGEAERYGQLKMLVRDGQIRDLRLQPKWELVVNGEKVGRFTGDFSYLECLPGKREEFVVEDYKSKITAAQEAYRLRVRLWKALYPGINFREVGK